MEERKPPDVSVLKVEIVVVDILSGNSSKAQVILDRLENPSATPAQGLVPQLLRHHFCSQSEVVHFISCILSSSGEMFSHSAKQKQVCESIAF